MGTDKAALQFGGLTLLEWAAHRALEADLRVLVVGRSAPDGWPFASVTFIEDALPDRGPLSGLETALHHAAEPVLALACDMPRLSREALRWLIDQGQGLTTEQGLVVLNGGQWEPLFSVYTPACLPLIESRRAAGRLSLHGLIEVGQFARADAPDWVAAQLVNVNTPKEFARL